MASQFPTKRSARTKSSSWLPTSILLSIIAIALLIGSCLANTAPTIRLSLSLNEGRVVHAPEGTPVNSLIGVMDVEDPDSGASGQVSCSTSNEYVGLIRMGIGVNMFKVVLKKLLDREVVERFDVSISCTDAGEPPKASTAVFSIVVIDINDNAPKFSSELYIAQISENEPDSTQLNVMVEATDPDSGENGIFEYTIEDENGMKSELFEIDPEKGHIYTLGSLDREEMSEISLIVRAMDFGIPPQSSSATVRVEILDRNDNPPMIVTHEMNVLEGLDGMSEVGKIKAMDADVGKNGEVRFSIAQGNDDGSPMPPFIVRGDGVVLAVVSLDREHRDSYTIVVEAKDQGVPSLSNTSSIHIIVNDANDNPPVITRPPSEGPYHDDSDDYEENENATSIRTLVINWYCPEDERIVYQAEATDKDLGENGRVSYFILSINESPVEEDSLFIMNPYTGEIQFRRCAQKTDVPLQNLVLAFRDNGFPALEVTTTLNISLDIDFSDLSTPHIPPMVEDDSGQSSTHDVGSGATTATFVFKSSSSIWLILCCIANISLLYTIMSVMNFGEISTR